MRALLEDAVTKGASLLHGSLFNENDGANRIRPVVLEDVKSGMDVYHRESFGPSVSLYVVSDDEQALTLANDTPYGLTAAVFTEDLR